MAQKWLRLLWLDKTRIIECQQCGSAIYIDSQRSSILIGGFIAVMVMPETRLLPFNWSPLWFVSLFAVYTPFYLAYTKLHAINKGDLDVTLEQAAVFLAYVKKLRLLSFIGRILVITGFLLLMVGMIFSSLVISEIIGGGFIFIIVGFVVTGFTRCPYCKSITTLKMFNNRCRCVNCHRDIGVSNSKNKA